MPKKLKKPGKNKAKFSLKVQAKKNKLKKKPRKPVPIDRLLKRQILNELDQTDEDWPGGDAGVLITRTTFALNTNLRLQTQALGALHGCHTCLVDLDTDSDQPWIGDHIPPTNLRPAARRVLGCDRWPTVLFPQCDECASEQSALVRALNSNPDRVLTAGERRLVLGGRSRTRGGFCIQASGPRVSSNEGIRIQALGLRNGCHSCRTAYPRSVYHADHVVPQEFATTYMEQVFNDLGIPYPEDDEFLLRPQCPRCSGQQGGSLRRISALAIKFARIKSILVYK